MALMEPHAFGRRGSGQDGTEKRKTKTALLQRLDSALTELNTRFTARTSGSASGPNSGTFDLNKDREKLEERVALCQMGKAVARVIELENEDGVGNKVRRTFSCCVKTSTN